MTDLTACDLCSDQGPLFLHARCHLTAPLEVELNGDELILRCYLPTCRREVGRFRIVRPGFPLAPGREDADVVSPSVKTDRSGLVQEEDEEGGARRHDG